MAYTVRNGMLFTNVKTHYPVSIKIVIGPVPKLIAWREKHKYKYGQIEEGFLKDAAAFVSSEGGDIGIFLAPDASTYIVVHEVVHAVWDVFQVIDTPLTDDTNETYAYLAGYLADKCQDALRAYREKGVSAY